jgi:hypothetical protein
MLTAILPDGPRPEIIFWSFICLIERSGKTSSAQCRMPASSPYPLSILTGIATVQPSKTLTAIGSCSRIPPGISDNCNRLNENHLPSVICNLSCAFRPCHRLTLRLRGLPFPSCFAPVAQLDRASDYGSEGCVFESRRVQIKSSSQSARDSLI